MHTFPSSPPHHPLIEELREYVDPRGGISERFESLELCGTASLAVLSVPLGRHRDLGWVICHSFGMEQSHLQPLEVAMARALAAEGFPVLRFHSSGYGESHAPVDVIGLGSHVADAEHACAALASMTEVSEVGLLGARFGGSVAALTAGRVGASTVVMWDPALSGSAYLHGIVRTGLVFELADKGRAGETARDPVEILDETGLLDVQGFPLTKLAHQQISSLSLVDDMDPFHGKALIIQVSRSARRSPAMEHLADRIRQQGGSVALEVVADPEAPRFGLPRFQPTGEGHKADRQAVLSAALIQRTIAWSRRLQTELSRQEV